MTKVARCTGTIGVVAPTDTGRRRSWLTEAVSGASIGGRPDTNRWFSFNLLECLISGSRLLERDGWEGDKEGAFAGQDVVTEGG